MSQERASKPLLQLNINDVVAPLVDMAADLVNKSKEEAMQGYGIAMKGL
jgi:hypothetical protein